MPKQYFIRAPYKQKSRNSISGTCFLPEGQEMPSCRICGKEMILFFQFDLVPELDVPFQPGSHLSLFMCPDHNEIPSFDRNKQLPSEYWNSTEGHWYALLTKPDHGIEHRSSEFLQPAQLLLSKKPQKKHEYFAVGGDPEWLQDSEEFICACGTEMKLICQLSDSYLFPKLSSAPEQPDSSSVNDYVLFLGNEVYVFGCPHQCNSRAVWVTVQN